MQNNIITTIGMEHYLILSALLFVIGVSGVLFRKNVIVMMMSIELMLNAVNITLITFSKYLGDMNGQVMVFFVMTVAAAEAAVGLAIIVNIFKRYKEVNIGFFEHLKG